MNDTQPPPRKQPPKPTPDIGTDSTKPNPGNDATQPSQSESSRRTVKTGLLLLFVLLLIVAAGAGAYWRRGAQARDEAVSFEREIGELREQLDRLQAEAEPTEAEEAAGEGTDTQADGQDTAAVIESAVTTGDYAALEPHLADPVHVILAASEAYGDQTPDQAVTNLGYLDQASGGWDFAPATSDLNSYRNGDYAQYFPVSAVVGVSSDDYVVSFIFDGSGDIGGIFISPDAGLLTP